MPLVGAQLVLVSLRNRLRMGCHLLVIMLHCGPKVVASAVCCAELNCGAQKPSPAKRDFFSGVATLAELRRVNCGDKIHTGKAKEPTAKVRVH